MCGLEEHAQPGSCVLWFIWTLLRTVAQEMASNLGTVPRRSARRQLLSGFSWEKVWRNLKDDSNHRKQTQHVHDLRAPLRALRHGRCQTQGS